MATGSWRGAFSIFLLHSRYMLTHERRKSSTFLRQIQLYIFVKVSAGLPSDHSHGRFLFFLLPPHKHEYIQRTHRKKKASLKLVSLELVRFSRHWARFCRTFFPCLKASYAFFFLLQLLCSRSGLREFFDGKPTASVIVQNLESLQCSLTRSTLGKETSNKLQSYKLLPLSV